MVLAKPQSREYALVLICIIHLILNYVRNGDNVCPVNKNAKIPRYSQAIIDHVPFA